MGNVFSRREREGARANLRREREQRRELLFQMRRRAREHVEIRRRYERGEFGRPREFAIARRENELSLPNEGPNYGDQESGHNDNDAGQDYLRGMAKVGKPRNDKEEGKGERK